MNRKILVLELWGLGDLIFSTPFVRAAIEAGHEIHVLAKPHAKPLLEATYPGVRFIAFHAPWTSHQGKYRLWHWNWREFASLVLQLREEHFDAVVSVRNDPRDHALMGLLGVSQRLGFPKYGSGLFLTNRLSRSRAKQHKVEDWREIGVALGLPRNKLSHLYLDGDSYACERVDSIFDPICKPVIVVHTGARNGVRRWPESYFKNIISRLRSEFDFHLAVIPDPDGHGSALASCTDTFLPDLTIPELVDVLSRSDLVLCNDSGPSHVAAACGRPVVAIFGPSDPDWFRPWGLMHKVIIRDICPWRPCFDYCRCTEAVCMTQLLPEHAWPQVRAHALEFVRWETGVFQPVMSAA